MSAPRPSVAQDNVSDPTRPASPRRCGEYGLCTHGLRLLGAPWGCRMPCPGTGSEASLRWALVVPPRWRQGSPPAAWCHGRWHQQSLHSTVHPVLPLGGYAWYRLCHGQWGWGRLAPPKTSLAHGSICRLPFPLYTSQVVTLLHQYRPYLDKYTPAYPTLESAVDGAVTTQFLGQMVPLAAATHSKDNPVEHLPLVGTPAPGGFGRVRRKEHRLDFLPQIIRYFPNGLQRSLFLHLPLLHTFGGSINKVSKYIRGFGIVTKRVIRDAE